MINKYRCSSFCSFYRGYDFIKGYIDNMLEQSIFDETEFIFVNCGSPENEQIYIEPLLNKYPNIKYISLTQDPGLYAGWNIAIQNSTSELITNWNIDDRKSKDGLEILVRELENNPQLDMVYGFTYISRVPNETYDQNPKSEIYPCTEHSMLNLLRHNSPHCMPMWKKNIHTKIGLFSEQFKTVSDAALWLLLSAIDGNIKMINSPVGLYYWNPMGQSTNPANQQLNHLEITQVKNYIIELLKQQNKII